MEKLSIYIHIPFCVRKCLYCDFLSAPGKQAEMEEYVKALCHEIIVESTRYKKYIITTVFIGGGTPSVLPGEWIEQILRNVYRHYQIEEGCEITIEANPGTITAQKLECWRRAGVNRLSIGLQSAIDEELRALGRIHSSQDFFATYDMIVKSGFNNINIDLMSAIPGQTLGSYQETLKKVAGLTPPPVHISAYSLIVEEGTPFYEKTPELPCEDTEREMYKMTHDFLCEKGYYQYEISNYAKPGFACRHNQVYWRRGNYVGFGIGAASLIKNTRFNNIRHLKNYMKMLKKGEAIKENVQVLSPKEQMEEFMFLGLRMMKGVSEEDFYNIFGSTIDQIYPGIVENFCRKGLLVREWDQDTGTHRIFLTRYGIDVSNIVMAEFLFT